MNIFCKLKRFIFSFLFCFLFTYVIFAQDVILNSFDGGNHIVLKSNGYYIAAGDNNALVAQTAQSADLGAVWEVVLVSGNWGSTYKYLKNKKTNTYLCFNITGSSYLLRETSGTDLTGAYKTEYSENPAWYMGQSYPMYYRPSVDNGVVSVVSRKDETLTELDNVTQAIEVSSLEEEGGVTGGETFSELFVKSENLERDISYAGATLDLSDAVVVARTVTKSASVGKNYYYVSGSGDIKVLYQTDGGDSAGETITEEEILIPTSVTIRETNKTILGQKISGSQVVLPINTTTAERSAVFAVDVVVEGNTYTRNVTLIQAANTSSITYREFTHSMGQANVAMGPDGLQMVHESEDVIYALQGETKSLNLQVVPSSANYVCGFYRWFNYETDATVFEGLNQTATYNLTANGKGVYVLRDTRPGTTTYTMGDESIKIACDISQYADYKITAATLIEPTLSYRMVYDIRPAQEIATALDKCKSTPLEMYNILAPAGATISIGPKYRWTASNDTDKERLVNYYYTSGGTIVRLDGYRWYKGGSVYTPTSIVDNRLIEITAPAAGESVVYELKTPTGLIIARFNITTQNISAIGPTINTIKTNAVLDKAYDLKAYRNFDYIDETSAVYSKPLAWDESTYGFTYVTGDAGNAKTRTKGFADWSEYALIQHTNLGFSWLQDNVKDHSTNGGNGYFLYIDANEMPGKVADLKINGNLCPNSSIWVSAWVVDANKDEVADLTYPNLNFIVTGIDAEGKESQILTYTTGEFEKVNRGVWHQVLFEVKLDEREFEQYRLRIDNNGASAKGNDFGIDDIRIYTTKPAIMGIQAMRTCPSGDSDANIALLRVDYNQRDVLSSDNADVYYRWVDSNGKVVNLDYLGNSSSYGVVNVDTRRVATDFGDTYYTSLADFIDNVTLQDGDVVEFYTTESGTYKDGTSYEHIVLYIAHNSSNFKVNNKYTAQLVVGSPSFGTLEDCASEYEFEVLPRARIVFYGEEQSSSVLQNLSVGKYPLAVKVYGTEINGSAIKSTTCASDWLIVSNDMTEAEIDGYAQRLVEFREIEGKNAGLQALSNGNYPGLYNLYNKGKLQLKATEIGAVISERGVPQRFIAVPIPDEASGFHICANPLEIILRAELTVVLANPHDIESYEDMPAAVQGSTCVIRIPESAINSELPQMDIDYINRDVIDLVGGFGELAELILCNTNDEEYLDEAERKDFNVYNIVAIDGTLENLQIDDLVQPRRTSTPFTLKAGKYYSFYSQSIDGLNITPAFNFDIYVVPNVVVWNPSVKNSAWHSDECWTTLSGAPAFIPLSETDVIIKSDVLAIPVLPENPKEALGQGANQYLKYDVGAEFNSCRNIYFESGASLARQHRLNYEKVYVDISFDKNGIDKWEMLCLPLRDVVRGDFYVPKSGDGTFDFAKSVAKVDNRSANRFRLKAYNSTIKNTEIQDGEIRDVEITSTAWTETANQLNMLLEPAKGYAISKSSTQDFVRLPKTAEEYYMFYVSGSGVESEIKAPWAKYGDIDRSESDKLVYDKDNVSLDVTLTNTEASNIFLVGNPFLVNLNVAKFFEVNSNLNGKFYYEYEDGVVIPIQSANKVLRPMRAMFVQSKSDVKSISVKFTPEMMSYNESSVTEVPTRVSRESEYYYADPKLRMQVEIGGVTACAYIEQKFNSTIEYSSEEDADMLMLDAELTPLGVYTKATNRAVVYNSLPEIEMVPLGIEVLDSTLLLETFNLSIEGVDQFETSLCLYDKQTKTVFPLIEGLTLALDLPQNEEERYYITRVSELEDDSLLTEIDGVSKSRVCVVSGDYGAIFYADKNIDFVHVYDMLGRLVLIGNDIQSTIYKVKLNDGVYLAEVKVGEDLWIEKVIVK